MNGFNDFPIETTDYELAAEYSNICRRTDIQGSNTDFLICAVAVRNNFEIFTTDDDFNYYKKYLPIKLFDIKAIGQFA
jgi:predicted nucleic acid-binding protein